jgi:hypothetical protein
MLILVDYDNVPPQRSATLHRLVLDVIAAVPSAVSTSAARAHIRFYGGWDTFNSTATQRAQSLAAQIVGVLPLLLPATAARPQPLTVTAELARSSYWLPHFPLLDTYRPRNPGQTIRPVRPSSCGFAHCTLQHGLSILTAYQCSPACPVSPLQSIVKDEQKQIDTLMVADLIHSSMTTSEPLVVVSSDDDLWPGIFAAISLRVPIVRMYTKKSVSQCSVTYEGILQKLASSTYEKATL